MGTSEEATDDFPVELFTILVSTFGLVLGCRSTHTLAMPYQKLLALGFCQKTDAFQHRGHFRIVGMGASEEATGAAADGQVHHDCQEQVTESCLRVTFSKM